ncbi:hypothetical protein ACF8C6_09120 [Pseudomonas sp. zbq_18]|uniref:hypothetical protein n=1 Tax=Pseudomonas sp. zbq_18 TaxID=3367251 RepID=UPI00370A3F79
MATIFDDTFAGPGELNGHVSDFGEPWFAFYRDDSPSPGPVGDVNVGLTHPLYPSGFGYPIMAVTDGAFLVGEGTWYVKCEFEIVEIPSSPQGVMEFGLYETSDGQLCATRFNVWDASVKFLYQPFGAPEPPDPTSVWDQIALGFNSMVMILTAAESGTSTMRLLFNDVEVMEFTSDNVWPSSKPYLLIRADAPIKITRFSVSDGSVASPEFWTRIVRAAETP